MTLYSAAAAALGEPQGGKPRGEKLSYQVKFDFQFSPTEDPPKVVTAINQVLRRWSDQLNDAEFYGANEQKIDMSNFPQKKTDVDSVFSLTLADKPNFRHIYALVEVRCFSSTFSQIKRAAWPLLLKYNVFVRQHFLGFKRIEVITPGWLLKVNPAFHDPSEIRDEIIEKAEIAFQLISKEDTAEIISAFPQFQDADGHFEVPEFHLARRNLKGDTKKHGKITADAFEIQVASADAGLLRRVLEVAFGLKVNQSDYLFVPYSLRSENAEIYAQLLGKQNDYMHNHRNISLAGLTTTLMAQALSRLGDQESFREMLQDQPGVYRVDPTRRLLDLGKWNISTDSQHYQDLKDWIDKEMPKFYKDTDTAGRFADFPVPTRLGHTARTSKPTTSTSVYSAQICQQFGDTDMAPTVQPARQAWQRPPVDIEYSLKNATDFPALNKIDDTKSTASSTRLTVSEDFKSLIGKELAQCKEDAQTARSELSQLKVDMSQMMTDIIRQELPAIVAEIQQQSASVFLTASEYKADTLAFQTSFHGALQAQTVMIQKLSRLVQDLQDTTPTRKRPAPSRQEDCIPRTLETDFPSQVTEDIDRFSPASNRPNTMQE